MNIITTKGGLSTAIKQLTRAHNNCNKKETTVLLIVTIAQIADFTNY